MAKLTDQDFDAQLTLRQSFQILVAFLEQFNSRGAQPTDDLQSWLLIESNAQTSDPAQLDDFLRCAQSVLAKRDA